MVETLRIGLIGVGRMGQLHLEAIISCKKYVELVALCDTNKKLLNEKCKELKVEGFTDFKEMLSRVKMDAVVIVLPHWLHLKAVREAVNKGINILKEKPLARNLKEAEEMVKLAEKEDIIFMIGTQRRYASTFSYAKKLLSDGLIGDPFLIRTQYVFYFMREEGMGWRAFKDKAGGGALLDPGYHSVDLVYWYMGMPKEVYCRIYFKANPNIKYETEDTALVFYNFANGKFGYSIVCWFSSPPEERVIVHGTKGALLASWHTLQLLSPQGEPIIVHEVKGKVWFEALRNQLLHFIECVRYHKEPLSSARENLNVMRIIEAAYKSASKGEIVKL